MEAHNAAVDNDVIEISDGTYTEASIETTKTLTFKGESAKSTIIQASANQPTGDVNDASPNMNIFKVTSDKTVIFQNLTMRHGNTKNQSGGAILAINSVNIIIENCNFFHNYAKFNGGAIYSKGSSTTIKNSSFANNTSGRHGGAIMAIGKLGASPKSSFSINNSTIYNNLSGKKGGAIAFEEELEFSLKNNTIAFNTTADDNRKGIYTDETTVGVFVTNNIFWNTESGGNDWGFEQFSSTDAVINNNIISNTSNTSLRDAPNSITWQSDPAATTENIDFGTFQDNGNGIFSLAISDTSIAKDAGDSSTATSTDTRGYDRDSNPDIGAYEYGADSSLSTHSNLLASTIIAPNPSNGTFNLKILNESSFSLDVYSLTGALLYSTQQSNKEIELPENIKGTVFIKVRTSNNTKVFKHIVQ
jgi:predicted outer membrane repeat protein